MLSKSFNIILGDIVSITGSSGKTTLMFVLARELSHNRVLVTTSTKIYMPSPEDYDYIYINREILVNLGITVTAKSLSRNKLLAHETCELEKLTPFFDYTFVESDGAKMKPLKAWNEGEPVIIPCTTKTIGVISLKAVGETIDKKIIHRSDLFRKHFSAYSTSIALEHIKNITLSKNGLFKNSKGDKILYINMIESAKDYENLHRLLSLYSKDELRSFNRILFGSLKEKRVWIYE